MDNLIMEAVHTAFDELHNSIPQTKMVEKSISISDVKPIELISFIEKNKIPDSARFDGKDNGYDGWDDILLSWDVSVPTNKEEKLSYCRKVFNDRAFRKVYQKLTNNGYKRTSPSLEQVKEFKGINLYDLYQSKNFDKIICYFKTFFISL